MKALFCIPVLALTLGFAQLATAAADDNTLQARATAMTRQLAVKVRLDEAQFVKVRRLNLRLLAETQALKSKLANDPAGLDLQLAQLQDRYEWDMASILWPRQLAAYQQSKASMTALTQPAE
jgi:hypothetical protein